jgi:hypothetical protein
MLKRRMVSRACKKFICAQCLSVASIFDIDK